MPDGVRIREPILTPLFDPEKFPYVIAMGAKWNDCYFVGHDYFMLNIKQGTSQVLVKAQHENEPFCCIQVGENAFDLHFSSWKEEDDKKEYEYHHKLSFKEDVIEVMQKGQLPFSLSETVKLVEGHE